jgi:hypothetical protein
VICYARFHRWCHAKRLVNVAEIVMQEVNRNRIPRAMNLFEKALVKLTHYRIFSVVPKIQLS